MFGDTLERWSARAGANQASACGIGWDDAGILIGIGLAILFFPKSRVALLTLQARSFAPAFSRLLSSRENESPGDIRHISVSDPVLRCHQLMLGGGEMR
jgi:hypothetical protein